MMCIVTVWMRAGVVAGWRGRCHIDFRFASVQLGQVLGLSYYDYTLLFDILMESLIFILSSKLKLEKLR